MNVCRFEAHGQIKVGLIENDFVIDLSAAGVDPLCRLLENENVLAEIQRIVPPQLPRFGFSEVRLLSPVDKQEVWAAGVTYLRSKTARMEESDFSANAYDRVYDAERPELFFKAAAEKVVGHEGEVGIRRDAHWNVPEPELALVFNSKGKLVGYTIGNDMSSRDIEGENLLYLPQAKTYNRSCAVGPWIQIGPTEETARGWKIQLRISRDGNQVFSGETSVGQIKRRFAQLGDFLFRCQEFPHGVVLLTGTGIVPPDSFTLQAADTVEIHIQGIGVLRNKVRVV